MPRVGGSRSRRRPAHEAGARPRQLDSRRGAPAVAHRAPTRIEHAQLARDRLGSRTPAGSPRCWRGSHVEVRVLDEVAPHGLGERAPVGPGRVAPATSKASSHVREGGIDEVPDRPHGARSSPPPPPPRERCATHRRGVPVVPPGPRGDCSAQVRDPRGPTGSGRPALGEQLAHDALELVGHAARVGATGEGHRGGRGEHATAVSP